MFGNPAWFREKRIGWGLRPITWQGWAYSLVWMLVLVAPFIALVLRGQIEESLVWLVASMGLLIWDVRQILQARRAGIREAREDVLYIGDEDADSNGASTPKYDLQIRR